MWKKLNFKAIAPSVRGEGHTSQEEWQRFVEGFDFFELVTAWRDLVGEKLAEVSIPLRLKNRTLFILTRHPAIADQMSYLERILLPKIAERFPLAKPMLDRIAFESNESFFLQRRAQHSRPAPPRLHPYSPEYRRARAEAEALFSTVSDPTERERWISLYIQSATPPGEG